ncbi:MAG: hypothetical protein HN348_00990 [Proteobacteria bacterium]|nr:hypothetical protein [Pseudomonadota bacterium]
MRVGLTLAEGRRLTPSGHTEHRVILSSQAHEALVDGGWQVTITRPDHRRGPPSPGYRDPDEGGQILRELAEMYERAGYAQIGESVLGRPLEALWLGVPPDGGAPVLRLLAAHHGDEGVSYEVALETASEMLDRDGIDPLVTALLDEATLWIVPYVNPDGVYAGSRYNANYVDLNRNYDIKWNPEGFASGTEPFSEPETRAIAALALYGGHPYISLTLHSGASNIGYPWNYTTLNTPDEAEMLALAEIYASSCETSDFWVTNGADWYTTRGDTNDWSYGRYGGMDFTVELSSTKTPPASELETMFWEHTDAIIGFLTTPYTVSGQILDEEGRPIQAVLTLTEGNGIVSAPFYSDATAGRFYRLAPSGDLTLRVAAPGWQSTNTAVAVGTDEALDLSIVLERTTLAESPPHPFVVEAGDLVVLPGAEQDDTAWLARPGYAPFEVDINLGVLEIPSLSPGPWTITAAQQTWPHGIFVTENDIAITAWERTEDQLEIQGYRFAPGTRSFGIWGLARHLHGLPVLEESSTGIALDLSDLPADQPLDLLIVSNGIQLAIGDIPGAPSSWISEDDNDTEPLPESGCGCNSSRTPLSIFVWALIFVARRGTNEESHLHRHHYHGPLRLRD